MARFDGKAIVITGGGAGIGRRYAHRFAAEGAAVAIADLDGDAGQRVADELAATRARGISVPLDVTDEKAAGAMAATVRDSL